MDLLAGGDFRPVILGDLKNLELLFRQSHLDVRSILMTLQEQIAELTTRTGSLETKVTGLTTKMGEVQTSIDAEQAEVAAVIALLSQPNPDIAAALAKLADIEAGLGVVSDAADAAKADVESTVTPPAPPA